MLQQKKSLVIAGVLALVVALAAGLTTWARTKAAGSTFAYVDVQRLSQEYLAPELEPLAQAETGKLQAELDGKIKKIDEALPKNATAEQKQKAEQDKQKLFNEYQQMLDRRHNELVQSILAKVNTAIAAVAKEQGYEYVFDKAAVVYGGKDLTDAVLLKLGVKATKSTSTTGK